MKNPRLLAGFCLAALLCACGGGTDAPDIKRRETGPFVTTLAGVLKTARTDDSNNGFSDGVGSAARFSTPNGVALDGAGNVYVADFDNHAIRKVTPAGVVTTLAGSGAFGSSDGTGAAARFNRPRGVAVDGSGNVYVADTENNSVRKITSAGVVTTVVGSFNKPRALAVDRSGNVFVADEGSRFIRMIDTLGHVTDFVDTGSSGLSSIAVDSQNNLYITNHIIAEVTINSHRVRKITPAGVISLLAGSSAGAKDGQGDAASFYYPSGIAVDSSGNVYVADAGNHLIRKITPGGAVSIFAGLAEGAGFLDGHAISVAEFNQPVGIAVDATGNLYIGDSFNHLIRKITIGDRFTVIK